jgi:hypothetical protein
VLYHAASPISRRQVSIGSSLSNKLFSLYFRLIGEVLNSVIGYIRARDIGNLLIVLGYSSRVREESILSLVLFTK